MYTFITFIYRIGNDEDTYYGKYVCDCMHEDHKGLDTIVKPVLVDEINAFRKQKGLANLNKIIKVGVMSFFESKSTTFTYASDEEIQCFDFYYRNIQCKKETYINGILVS